QGASHRPLRNTSTTPARSYRGLAGIVWQNSRLLLPSATLPRSHFAPILVGISWFALKSVLTSPKSVLCLNHGHCSTPQVSTEGSKPTARKRTAVGLNVGHLDKEKSQKVPALAVFRCA